MWAIVRRAVVPVLLVIAGVAALVDRRAVSSIPCCRSLVEQETKTTIDIPLALPPGPMGDPPSPEAAAVSGRHAVRRPAVDQEDGHAHRRGPEPGQYRNRS